MSDDDLDRIALLHEFIAQNIDNPDKEAVVSEIQVLQSIYGDDTISLYAQPPKVQDGTVRYEVVLRLPSPHDDVAIKVLVSLPPLYPKSAPPQLQLLSKYIGAFGADSTLFGAILRTYISTNGVEWTEDTICVFDGLQNVLDRCTAWYEDHLNAEPTREDQVPSEPTEAISREPSPQRHDISLLSGIEIFLADPITDRKSSFVGRACAIQDPSQVSTILTHLMSDRRIARAAHPIINAWRCEVDGVLHQDNDDDGESAAGGRLAHLLQILDVKNVLVVVTRYFGGIHLGPDRFKHINQAARNALELGGFLDSPADPKRLTGRGKKHV